MTLLSKCLSCGVPTSYEPALNEPPICVECAKGPDDSCYKCGSASRLQQVEAELNADYSDGELTVVSMCERCIKK